MPKRNLNKIPPRLLAKLNAFETDEIVAACTKLVHAEDIDRYHALGLRLADGRMKVISVGVPPMSAGRYSRRNVEGYEVVRKDLPMTTQTRTFETPNFGDWSRGSHDVSWSCDVYIREFMPPRELELKAEIIREGAGGTLVKFEVDQVLSKQSSEFEDDLLFNLNLLQENVGAADVFSSAATLADFAATIHVDWQILPPGTVDEVVTRMLSSKNRVTADLETVMRDRITVFAELKPTAYVAGTDRFLRYFGAKFGEDLVVFENANYGNAIYVMRANWQDLSKRSRLDLLKGTNENFDRIIHTDGWKERLRVVIKEYQATRKK